MYSCIQNHGSNTEIPIYSKFVPVTIYLHANMASVLMDILSVKLNLSYWENYNGYVSTNPDTCSNKPWGLG